MLAVVIETNPGELVAEGQCIPQDVQIFNLPDILQKRLDGQLKQREISSNAAELNVKSRFKRHLHVVIPKTFVQKGCGVGELKKQRNALAIDEALSFPLEPYGQLLLFFAPVSLWGGLVPEHSFRAGHSTKRSIVQESTQDHEKERLVNNVHLTIRHKILATSMYLTHPELCFYRRF